MLPHEVVESLGFSLYTLVVSQTLPECDTIVNFETNGAACKVVGPGRPKEGHNAVPVHAAQPILRA